MWIVILKYSITLFDNIISVDHGDGKRDNMVLSRLYDNPTPSTSSVNTNIRDNDSPSTSGIQEAEVGKFIILFICFHN